jgi:hypothetical protein
MTTDKSTLTITFSQSHRVGEWDDITPAQMDVTVSADVTDANVHQWFALFQNILALAGYSERVIMDGACRLAFNEWRNQEDMKRLAHEYELNEFLRPEPTIHEQPA